MTYADAKLNETKVFKDPVHKYVYVKDQVIWDLIATKEFQRLRRIKQLGTTYITFHGAEHSRFGHSLGVYEIVRRMIDDVFADRKEWNGKDRLLALVAALLHDVGHGPFSHSFEKVFDFHHEDFTKRIILEDTEIHQVLKQVSPQFPKQVADIIAHQSENKLVTSMISSQIDADRMDYLLRDAYFTGVSYGKFDLERLLRVMRPTEDGMIMKSTGMHAVEHYIMSRYQMYWQVYFHPVTRSAEVILHKILHRAKELYKGLYKFEHFPFHFVPFFEQNFGLHHYIKLDEAILMYYFEVWQEERDTILSDLCKRFINRKLFKYYSFQVDTNIENYMELRNVAAEKGWDPEYYVVRDSTSDLPYDFYRPGETGEKLPIYLLMPDGEKKELSRMSTIVESITGKVQKDSKIFFPEELYEDAQSLLR